jgi:transcriptional regulator with XRE-family HTH domain
LPALKTSLGDGSANKENTMPKPSTARIRQRSFEEELLVGEATETLVGLVESLELPRKDLATRLKLSPGRVSQILSGRENLTLRSLAALGWAMGVRFELHPTPIADRKGTPAEGDAPLPLWLARLGRQAPCTFKPIDQSVRRSRPELTPKRLLSLVNGDLRDVA